MKKVYKYIIGIVLLLPLGVQAQSVREYMQSVSIVPPIVDGNLNFSECGITSLDGLEDIPHPETIHMLDLEGNQLETIPAGVFDRFTNVERIDLSNNSLRELPAYIFNAHTQLIGICLNDNQLTTLDADIFHNQTKLESLDLSNNQLYTLPAEIFNTTSKLGFLQLNDNKLQELPETIFSNLTQLQTVILANNRLNVIRAHTFENTTDLITLDLSGNHLRTLPAGIFNATRRLNSISLNNNKLQTLPQDMFAGLKRLRCLYIDDNYLPGTEEEFKQYYLSNKQLDDFEFKSEEQWEKELFQHEVLDLLNNPELDQDNINALLEELKQDLVDIDDVDQEENQPRMAIVRDTRGNTVLHKAVMLRNPELVNEILRLWPHLLKVKNNGGRTPLHVAAGLPEQTKKDREIAYQLFAQILVWGRKHRERLLTLKDNDGNTPIQLALKNKQNLIFEKLLSLIPMQLAQQQ